MKMQTTLSLLCFFVFLFVCVHAQNDSDAAGCPQIDLTKTDTDGMPFCPGDIRTSSAWEVYRCAIPQTKVNLWHTPTMSEKHSMSGLLSSWLHALHNGISENTTSSIRTHADKLGLQVCRVSGIRKINGKQEQDSFLLAYTKPGVHDYSGPFLMLREIGASNVAIIGPHDGVDGTHHDTKFAVSDSHALILISNGYKKGITNVSDFVHNENTLGTVAVRQLASQFPHLVWLHVHGMKIPDHVLYRSRNNALAAAFEKGIVEYTNIPSGNFHTNFNAHFSVDQYMGSMYLKTEIPARIHEGNLHALAGVIRTIENNTWAWPAGISFQ
jgi:hypothetical protein